MIQIAIFCNFFNVIPFQGAVEGPSEFAEGLVIGVRSVFSGVIGGAAGTVSRITGALGKGLASLTFDEKFQVTHSNHYLCNGLNVE